MEISIHFDKFICMDKKTVVLGHFGQSLDRGRGPKRWERWRPTLTLVRQPDFVVHRLELFHTPRSTRTVREFEEDIRVVSPETEVRTHVLPTEDPWNLEEVFEGLMDFAKGYPFDLEHEEYFVHITTGTHIHQISLFLLAESRHFPARLIQTSPPRRALDEDVGRIQIIDLDLRRYDRLAARFQEETLDRQSFLKSGISTRNPAFNQMIDELEEVAVRSRDPMLLEGPTGSGKSQLARRIYELKVREQGLSGPFVDVNCATLKGDTAKSALFGHAKGAFTGAQQARDGLLKRADSGMLFLDEIGELGADEQAMLLKAIEEGIFYPVGSDETVSTQFELVAGTHRDLRCEVEAGRFREDLWSRIRHWTFRLPSLKDRPEDFEPNLDFELERLTREFGRSIRIHPKARNDFLEFATSPQALWRGNFRDFVSAVRRMATLAPSGRIRSKEVQRERERLESFWGGRRPAATGGPYAHPLLQEVLPKAQDLLDPFEAAGLGYVLEVLSRSKTLSEAGRELYRVSRAERKSKNDADRLRKYLAKFGLDARRTQSLLHAGD